MELELKHLAAYLPYGLKLWDKENKGVYIPTLIGIKNKDSIVTSLPRFPYNITLYIHEFKPILRPLSDLDKKYLDHMYFVIISTDNDMFGSRDQFEDYFNETDCEYLPQCLFEYLLECHFDVFGLIQKGLAIDINKTK